MVIDPLKRVRLEELPESSELGGIHRRLLAQRDRLGEIINELDTYRKELRETQEWLKQAKYGQTEPLEYAAQKAKVELLEASIREIEPRSNWEGQNLLAIQSNLKEAVDKYNSLFEQAHSPKLLPESRQKAANAILRMIT
jgi:GTPase involved in cell partitioning and DNA repair